MKRWLALILLLAATLRLFGLGSQSLWSDEGLTLHQAMKSLPLMWEGLKEDVHPPLYYGLMHFWVQGGQSELWLRLSSLLAGLFSIACTGWLLADLAGAPTALGASLLMACSAFHLACSQEFRSHIFVCAAGTASMLALRLWLRRGGWTWALLWVTATWVLLYLNFFGYLLLGPLFLIGLRFAPRPRFAAAFGLVLAGSLPFLLYIRPFLAAQARREGWVEPEAHGLMPFLRLFRFLALYHDYPQSDLSLDHDGALGLTLSLALLALALWGARHLGREAAEWLLLWWLVPPCEAMFLATFFKLDLFVLKYFLLCLPPMLGLLAAGLLALGKRSRPAAAALAAGLLLLNFTAWGYRHFDLTFSNPDWRGVGGLLNRFVEPHDLVIVQPGMEVLSLAYYYHGDLGRVVTLDDASNWPTIERDWLPGAKRVWLVLASAYPQVIQAALAGRLAPAFHEVKLFHSPKRHPASELEVRLFER